MRPFFWLGACVNLQKKGTGKLPAPLLLIVWELFEFLWSMGTLRVPWKKATPSSRFFTVCAIPVRRVIANGNPSGCMGECATLSVHSPSICPASRNERGSA